MFINPVEDCPDKLIWALIGWLAWEHRPETYRDALTELRDLLEFVFENQMRTEEELEAQRQREREDEKLLEQAKAAR